MYLTTDEYMQMSWFQYHTIPYRGKYREPGVKVPDYMSHVMKEGMVLFETFLINSNSLIITTLW